MNGLKRFEKYITSGSTKPSWIEQCDWENVFLNICFWFPPYMLTTLICTIEKNIFCFKLLQCAKNTAYSIAIHEVGPKLLEMKRCKYAPWKTNQKQSALWENLFVSREVLTAPTNHISHRSTTSKGKNVPTCGCLWWEDSRPSKHALVHCTREVKEHYQEPADGCVGRQTGKKPNPLTAKSHKQNELENQNKNNS